MGNISVILASASPRRRELLSRLGIDFDVIPALGAEHVTSGDPVQVVQQLAAQKASEVLAAQKVSEVMAAREASEVMAAQKASEVMAARETTGGAGRIRKDPLLVIGADTIVVKDGKILGKPRDEDDAYRMLSCLQNDVHQVYTGVSLILRQDGRERTVTFYEMTKVYFDAMTDAQIRAYIATGDPMDKAGAYGIQSGGGAYIRRIEGDYNNVVGLPLRRLEEEMAKLMGDVRPQEKRCLERLVRTERNHTPMPPVKQRENAVLLPLIETDAGYDILFEKRSLQLKHQPGDVCLPGGGIQKPETPVEAAIRETQEELLVQREQIEVLFSMDGLIGPGERTVWPFAALLKNYDGSCCAQEVDHTFRVPLSFFLEHPPHVYQGRRTTVPDDDFPFEKINGGRSYWNNGYKYDILLYEYEDHVIWGVTARIVNAFVNLCRGESRQHIWRKE